MKKLIIVCLFLLLSCNSLFAADRKKISLIPTDAAITMTAGKTLTITGDATISATPYTPSGTDVAVADGGTGLSSIADGSVLATNAANVLSAITWHDTGTKVLTNTSGTISWETAGGAGATAWDDIADPDADGSIAFAGYEQTITSTLDEAAHTVLTITDTDADLANSVTLLKLTYTDDGSANGNFFECLDNASGDSKFKIGANGAVTAGAVTGSSLSAGSGTITGGIITATTQLICSVDSDTAATSPLIDFRKARDGDPDSDMDDNDYLGELRFRGYHTAGYYEGAIIRAVVNGTPGADDMPAELIFATSADGSATPTTRLTIDAVGLSTFAGDVTVSGGDIVLGTTSIFSGGDTASLNNIDAIDATTETTLEAAIDTLGSFSEGGLADSTVVSADIKDGTVTAADTAITAGRSLSWSTNDISADAELYTQSKSMTIETPTDADNFFFFVASYALTVTKVTGIVESATSAVLTIQECDSAGDNAVTIESVTADVDGTISTDIDNASVDAGDVIRVDVGTVTGTVGQAHVTVVFTADD